MPPETPKKWDEIINDTLKQPRAKTRRLSAYLEAGGVWDGYDIVRIERIESAQAHGWAMWHT